MSTSDYSHFAALNALIDSGWLAVLSKPEQAVWLAYLRHADNATGISYPGPRRIANYLGHTQTRHVRKVRERLISLGLLSVVKKGGGRECAKLRVNVPPTPPQPRPRSRSDRGRNRSYQQGQGGRTQPSPSQPDQPSPGQGNEGLSDPPKEENNKNNSAAVGVVDHSLKEESVKKGHRDARQQAAWEALRDAGICEPTRSRLIDEIPTLRSDAVQTIRKGMDDNAGTGALVNAIKSDGAAKSEELQKAADAIEAANRARDKALRAQTEQRRASRKEWLAELHDAWSCNLPRHQHVYERLIEYWRVNPNLGLFKPTSKAGIVGMLRGNNCLGYFEDLTSVLKDVTEDARKMMAIVWAREHIGDALQQIEDDLDNEALAAEQLAIQAGRGQ